MIVLAIETSCDDTCIAIIRADEKKLSKIKVLANLISSQVKIHQKYGGVYPFLAKREHQKNLPILFKKAKKQAKFASRRTKIDTSAGSVSIPSDSRWIDLIAVTVGPGLAPCLWTGVNFAKDLAAKLKVPIIPINHIEAHIYANFVRMNNKQRTMNKIFPAISLVVSGGHTQLILARDFGKYEILGETRDDAAGECFDKIARILGLGYPGGPAIEKEAAKTKNTKQRIQVSLPRPMMYQKNYDFSFSGLKTAALYHHKKQTKKTKKSKEYIKAMSAEAQQAIIDVLIHKTIKAAKKHKVKTIILGGGVSANKELRKQMAMKIKKEIPDTKYKIPDAKLSTDNALMIALTAYHHWLKSTTIRRKNWKKITVDANLRV